MSEYRASWRALADARAEVWEHSADLHGWCKAHREMGTWVRAGECCEYLQAKQVIDLAESNRQSTPPPPGTAPTRA